MFDKIEKKVHDIRREPEHIRMRYVWGMIVFSMSVVVFIWVMSMKTNLLQIRSDNDTYKTLDSLQEQIDEIKSSEQQPISIDELLENESAQPEM